MAPDLGNTSNSAVSWLYISSHKSIPSDVILQMFRFSPQELNALIQTMLGSMQRYSLTLVGFAGSRRMGAVLSSLACIFMLKKASNRLSLWAHNNYMSDKTWDWGKELVVITGGCGGIGALVVSKLAAKNIKVVIFDIVEPNTKLGKFPSPDSNPNSYQDLCIDFIFRRGLCLLQS